MRYRLHFLLYFLVPYVLSSVFFHCVNLSLPTWLTLSTALLASGLIMHYGAKYLTDYLVSVFGSEIESNDAVRKMYETNDFTMEKLGQVVIFSLWLVEAILAIFKVISSATPVSLALGFCIFITRDFIHDYRVYREMRRFLYVRENQHDPSYS